MLLILVRKHPGFWIFRVSVFLVSSVEISACLSAVLVYLRAVFTGVGIHYIGFVTEFRLVLQAHIAVILLASWTPPGVAGTIMGARLPSLLAQLFFFSIFSFLLSAFLQSFGLFKGVMPSFDFWSLVLNIDITWVGAGWVGWEEGREGGGRERDREGGNQISSRVRTTMEMVLLLERGKGQSSSLLYLTLM